MSEFNFPESWVQETLGELVQVERGSSPRPIVNFITDSASGVNWIKIGDTKEGQKYVRSTKEKITPDGAQKSRFVDVGDFILSNSMSFGRPYIMAIKGCIHDGWFALRLPKQINSDYFYYLLFSSTIKNQFDLLAVGGVVKNISGDLVKRAVLPLSSLAEQQQIAQKLDELLAQVDTLKTRLDAIPNILKRFRQSVLAAAVSGRLTEGGEPIVNLTIGDIADDIRYGTSKKCDESLGATPVLRIPNIGDKGIDLTNLKYADFEPVGLEKLKLKTGDILIIRSNGSVDLVGKAALIKPDFEHCLFAGYLIRIRLNLEVVVPAYVLMCLQSVQTRKIVELQARSTSGVNNINSQELAAIPLVVPTISKQTEIVRRVEQLFAYADQIEQRVRDAQVRVNHLTQSILAKAFRGELTADWRAQNPELISGENSAAALLERIRVEREAAGKTKRKVKA